MKEKVKMDRSKESWIKHRLQCRVRSLIKEYKKSGRITQTIRIQINYEKIVEHLKPFPRKLHSNHIDHIIPLCNFNLEDQEQAERAFAPENHRWIPAKENLHRKKKYDLTKFNEQRGTWNSLYLDF